MAASESDFTDLAETGLDIAAQWPQLVRIMMDMRSLWRARSEVSDEVISIDFKYLGTERLRIRAQSTVADLSYWNGSAYVVVMTLNNSTVTLSGSLTVAGDIDLAGNDLVNVGLIDTFDPAAHWAQHAFGGGDAPTAGTPSSVGTANAAGSSPTFIRADHVHAGGTGFTVGGSALQTGQMDIVVVEGLTIIKTGNQVSFDANFQSPIYDEDNTSTGDQSIGASTSEVDIAGLTQIAFPETPDATKKWTMYGQVLFHMDTPNQMQFPTVRLYKGSTGDLGDSLVQTFGSVAYQNTTAYEHILSIVVGPITILPGAGNTHWGLSFQNSPLVGTPVGAGANSAIKGSAGLYSYMELIPRYHE
jgi:hypothetical protein